MRLYGAIVISGKLTLASGQAITMFSGTFDNTSGELEINAGSFVYQVSGGTFTNTGTISGSSTLRIYYGTFIQSGTVTVSDFSVWIVVDSTTITLAGGTFSSSTSLDLRSYNTANGTIVLGTGASQTLTVLGNLTVGTTSSGTVEIDNGSNSVDIVIEGDFSVDETSTTTWTAGGGTITFSGTANQTVTTPAGWTQELEDIVITKLGGQVTLAGGIYTDSLDFQDGDLDLDGNTIDSAGNVTVDGSTGARFWNGADEDMNNGAIDIASGTLTLTGSA
jgi:hypothetical protein